MKKIVLLVALAFVFASCGKEKKEVKTVTSKAKVEVKETVKEVKTEVASNSQAEKGKELFASKGCVACHQVANKVVGPALKDIAKTYTAKKGNMFNFLRGKADAIVDTDPGQVAIMKANITGMVKDMKDDEIKAVIDYISSTAK